MKKTVAFLIPFFLLTGCSDNMSLSTENIVVPDEGTPPTILYTVTMNSEKMFGGVFINEMEQLDNLSTDEGDVMTGFNATAFLEPGINGIGLLVASADVYEQKKEHRPEGQFGAVLSAVTRENHNTELTSLNISVDDGKPTAKTSETYPAKHQTELTDFNGVTEGYATTFNRQFFIKTIPEWNWVRASPFVENGDNMKKLYRAYSELHQMIENKKFSSLKAAWSLSSREKAMAEGYSSTADEFYRAVGIESSFEDHPDIYVEPIGEWSDYTLVSFANGRLVRLVDSRDSSPLRLVSPKEDLLITFLPYFSIIDGRVVISR
ncbi:glycosyl hydrolase family 26 [Enterovibrio baiacu]|uniref:glycosyl hydrolase family 26 n=1 Tax=Enterovibrio baiacu TaxID=2491023 RepID=UPI003D0F0994